MRGSSERNRSSFYRQPLTLSTYYGLKSTNDTIQYFYSLSQLKCSRISVKNHGHHKQSYLDGLGVMLTKCSPILNGFWQNQQEAVANACLALMIECTQ